MQISDGNNPPWWPISGSSSRGGAMERMPGQGHGEARAGGGGKEWKKDGERQCKHWKRRSRVPEIALRNLSGARRTGIGFRFCQGAGANVAHPVRELFWGEKKSFFSARSGLQEGGGSARLRGCLPKLLLRSRLAPSSMLGWGMPSPQAPGGDVVTPNLCPAAVVPSPDPQRIPLLYWAFFQEFHKNFLPFPLLLPC